MLDGIVKVIKNYLSVMGIDCRVSKNQIQIAYTEHVADMIPLLPITPTSPLVSSYILIMI